jgi:hypothetical protein
VAEPGISDPDIREEREGGNAAVAEVDDILGSFLNVEKDNDKNKNQ